MAGSLSDRALQNLVRNFNKLTKKQRANFSARTRETVNQAIRNKAKRAGQGTTASSRTQKGR